MRTISARCVRLLDAIAQDVRYGVRVLWRSPWFTTIGVASLAIGLGSSVALFTFMNAVLFRPLPGRSTGDIHAVYTSNSDAGRYGPSSLADFQSFTTSVPGLFAAACATTNTRATLMVGTTPHVLAGTVLSGGCFETLRLRPHVGRLLSPSDDSLTGDPTAIVISHAFWSRTLGSDPAIVGRDASLNGASAVIAGVAEAGFAGTSLDAGADFWAPAALAPVLLSPDSLTARTDRRFRVYVRLADNVTAAQAADRLAGVAAGLRQADPPAWTQTNGATRTVTIAQERRARFATSSGAAEAIGAATFGAIAALVAIACVNLATMMVARGAGRTRELNVRLALGASRRRLLRQLAIESLLMSVMGLAAGILIVLAALRLFEVYRPAEVPAFNLAIDWRVALFSTLIAIAAPLGFGLMPAAHALRLAIAEGVKGRYLVLGTGSVRFGARELLVTAQLAVSFALLIAATLFMGSLTSVAPGHQRWSTGRVAVASVDLNTAARSDAERQMMTARVLQAADAVPNVEGATAAAVVPMTGSFMGVVGRPDDRPGDAPQTLDANVVAPGYMELAGVALRAGRRFDARDHQRAPSVAIVSESLARRFWHSPAVVGRVIHLNDEAREIIGVVEDVPYRSFSDPSHPVVYVPMAQSPRHRFVIHARVASDGEAIAALSRALRAVDARILVGPAMPLRQLMDQTRTGGRVAQWIGTITGALQLGLTLMATWALVSYAVQRRLKEIAVRRAIGATEASILRLVMRPSLWLLAVGAPLGVVGGVVAAVVLHSSFIGLAPIDPRLAVPSLLVLAAVVVAGVWWPARQAVAIEPAAGLKDI